jgi:carbon-monoxide dehydrogenase large subunit
VRYVGDHVAAVFAETLEQAMSAAELIDVTYSEMPAITDLKSAMDSPQIHDGMENNTYFDWELGDEAATNDAFDKAATIVNVDIRNNRVIPNAMEPRAAVADYDYRRWALHAFYHIAKPPADPPCDWRVHVEYP